MYSARRLGGENMDVRVCKHCKRMFQHISGPSICPRCKQVEEEQFQTVKEYLRKNPGAMMHIVSSDTKVPISLIESFLKQGRLEVSADSPIALSCESCGTKIPTGKYCKKCQEELVSSLSAAVKEIQKSSVKEEKTGEKMRFLQPSRIK